MSRTVILTCCVAGWPGDKPEGTEVWGTTETYKTQPNLDRIYFMDKLDPHLQTGWENMEGLKAWGGTVYTLKHYPDLPRSKAYPIDDVINEFKRLYFTSSTAYMLAHAIYDKADHIILHEIATLAHSREYYHQKDCLDFWCGVAEGRGIKVDVSPDSYLMKGSPWCSSLYGYLVNEWEDYANITLRNVLGEVMALPREFYVPHPESTPACLRVPSEKSGIYPEKKVMSSYEISKPVHMVYKLDCGHSAKIVSSNQPQKIPSIMGCPSCYSLERKKKELQDTGDLKHLY